MMRQHPRIPRLSRREYVNVRPYYYVRAVFVIITKNFAESSLFWDFPFLMTRPGKNAWA